MRKVQSDGRRSTVRVSVNRVPHSIMPTRGCLDCCSGGGAGAVCIGFNSARQRVRYDCGFHACPGGSI